MIKLPAPLELEFKTLVDQIQEEKKMPYINTFERLARQEGRQEAEERALQEKLASARQLLSLGVLNDEQIAEVLNLPLEKISQLRSD